MTTKGHVATTTTGQMVHAEQEVSSAKNGTAFIQVALIVLLYIAYVFFEPHSPVWQLIPKIL